MQSIVRDTPDELRRALDAALEHRAIQDTAVRASADVHALGTGHITVLELCERWLAWKTGPDSDEPIRSRTAFDYRKTIDAYIAPLIGSADSSTITQADIRRDFIRASASRTFARFGRSVLNQAFRWALAEDPPLVARRDNPATDVRLVRRDGRDGRNRNLHSVRAVTEDDIPTPAELEKMLDWCLEVGKPLWWLWVYLAAYLGLRPSECSALHRDDFDVAGRVVHIRRSAPHRCDAGDWSLKTETSYRLLPIPSAEFWDTIVPHLPETGWLFEARARGGGRPQRTHTATPVWAPDAPSREMRIMRRALGLSERYHPYSLRHYRATRLILAGKTEIQVAKFLGTSVQMLQQVYANHLDRDAQRDIGSTPLF